MKPVKALLDTGERAIVVKHYPNGSSSYLFPHYKVRLVGGGQRPIVVASNRLICDYDITELDADGFPTRRPPFSWCGS